MDMLQLALEDNNSKDKKIVLQGPLADAYREALQIEFSKNKDNVDQTTGSLSTETIQMDNEIGQRIVDAVTGNDDPPPTDSYQKIYGVSKDDVDEETVIDVTKNLTEDASKVDTEFVLVIDTTDSNNNGNYNDDNRQLRLKRVTESLKVIVESYGGKCYSSLQEYIKNR